MSFDWNQYLQLAEQLAGVSRDEVNETAKLRTAISRAYYAVYHLALSYGQRRYNRILNERRDTHRQIQDWFEDSPFPEEQKLHNVLLTVKGRRVRADYQNAYSNLERDAITSIELARDILELFAGK